MEQIRSFLQQDLETVAQKVAAARQEGQSEESIRSLYDQAQYYAEKLRQFKQPAVTSHEGVSIMQDTNEEQAFCKVKVNGPLGHFCGNLLIDTGCTICCRAKEDDLAANSGHHSTATGVCTVVLLNTTTIPGRHVRHIPDQVLPWLGVEAEALAFRETLPATPAMYDGYTPATMQPGAENSSLINVDNDLFPVVNQLGGVPGLAPVMFNEYANPNNESPKPKKFNFVVVPDRVWTCNGRVIGKAEGKQPQSRPTLPGHELLAEYNPDMPNAKATAQLQQVCGQLHHNGLKYGLLYTDKCFWFMQYDSDSANGILYVSEGILVSQKQPTVFLMLLYTGHLAQQYADAAPSLTCRQSLPLVLNFWGSLHNMIATKRPPESSQHQLHMGAVLGQGSTGTVRVGRIDNVDVAVKLLEGVDDSSTASQRLHYKLHLYRGFLSPLQGSSVPRLLASGTVAGPSGIRLPFLALELLPVSLTDVAAQLGGNEYDKVLEALHRTHEHGVLHGDIEPRHVTYSSQHTLAEPKWVDFGGAQQAQSSERAGR